MTDPLSESRSDAAPLFPATQWSALIAVREGEQNEALQALDRLARAYWQPLYVFARRRGGSHEQAADAVQGFFAHLVSGETLRHVEKRETRFRSFLLKMFQNWMNSQYHRDTAKKRGAGAPHVTLEDFDSIESDPALISDEAPGRSFDRRWARSIFDHALKRLDQEISQKNNPELFAELRKRIAAPGNATPDWRGVAEKFGMQENAVKQAAYVLRQRLAVLLREEVRAVVSTDADLEDELRYLVQLLSSPGGGE